MNNKKMLFYKIDTPLHMGSGIDLSVVDMPIAREKHTGFPKLESSGIKGALRNYFNKRSPDWEGPDWENKINILFGPEDDGSKHSSSLVLYEGKILLFPVKTLRGVFGWITCPMVLNRFKEDMIIFKDDAQAIDKLQVDIENTILSDKSNIKYPYNTSEKKVVIEEFTFEVDNYANKDNSLLVYISKKLSKNIQSSLIKDKISKDIFVVSDDAFNYFVNMSTEISTRVRLENGIVSAGPFTEEYVPAETVFYGFAEMNNIPKNAREENLKEEELFEEFIEKLNYIQLGGNTTLGKGLVKIINVDL